MRIEDDGMAERSDSWHVLLQSDDHARSYRTHSYIFLRRAI